MRGGLALIATVLVVLGASACSGQATSASAKPDFEVIVTNWLLCPQSATDLKTCCPQPADPRRCVMPAGTAPTDLVAYARFRNSGGPGNATAMLGVNGDVQARCSAQVPFTAAGGTAIAWCSLGSTPEPVSPPKLVSLVTSP